MNASMVIPLPAGKIIVFNFIFNIETFLSIFLFSYSKISFDKFFFNLKLLILSVLWISLFIFMYEAKMNYVMVI